MSYNSQVAVSAVPTNVATEGAVATSSPVTVNQPGGQGNDVYGMLNVTAGTGTTAVVIRVRAGVGIGGALVGSAMTHTLAAGASASIPFEVSDPVISGANLQYTVTIQQTGGTVAGTVNYCTIGVNPAVGAS